MKVIELLNKIANEEEPNKIKYNDRIYELYKEQDDYYDYYRADYFLDGINCIEQLNDEIEIIEEEKKFVEVEEKQYLIMLDVWNKYNQIKPVLKKIEKINAYTSQVGAVTEDKVEEYIHKLFEQQSQTIYRLNQIIDYINKGE